MHKNDKNTTWSPFDPDVLNYTRLNRPVLGIRRRVRRRTAVVTQAKDGHGRALPPPYVSVAKINSKTDSAHGRVRNGDGVRPLVELIVELLMKPANTVIVFVIANDREARAQNNITVYRPTSG